MNTDTKINELIYNYYYSYYNNMLGISNWNSLIENRFKEDEGFYCKRIISQFEEFIGKIKNKKILIVGAGTGGEMAYFKRLNNEVFCIEPDKQSVEILKIKAEKYNIKSTNIFLGFGENLPFTENKFDLVYCSSVLEHVKDVKTVIEEMIRVVNINGKICITTPNFLYPMERHYKISAFPPALPFGKFLLKIRLKLLGRPLSFVKTLNFITDRTIKKILKGKMLNNTVSCAWLNPVHSSNNFLVNMYCKLFGVFLSQRIVISKKA